MIGNYIQLLSSDEIRSLKPYHFLKQSELLMDEIKRLNKWIKKSPYYTDGETIGDLNKSNKVAPMCNPVPYFVSTSKLLNYE